MLPNRTGDQENPDILGKGLEFDRPTGRANDETCSALLDMARAVHLLIGATQGLLRSWNSDADPQAEQDLLRIVHDLRITTDKFDAIG